MQIKINKKFETNLKTILDFIAKDKISASNKFKKDLFLQIKNIPNFPYKYRKSIYFNDENIRDMIFKGYTIVYRIKPVKEEIEILGIFNKNKPPIK